MNKLPNGTYKTAAGSILVISGKSGGKVDCLFDWAEEPEACCDCTVEPYPDEDLLTWSCEYCGGGAAKLEKVSDSEVTGDE